MTEPVIVALVGVGVAVVGGAGTALGAWLAGRAQRKAAEATAAAQTNAARAAAAAVVKTSEDSSQDKLIDQLQEELARYRSDSDQRATTTERRVELLEEKVERLTAENAGYRAFIGVQRDHMAEHGVPLPPWPQELPR